MMKAPSYCKLPYLLSYLSMNFAMKVLLLDVTKHIFVIYCIHRKFLCMIILKKIVSPKFTLGATPSKLLLIGV